MDNNKYWSNIVTQKSNALMLKPGIFTWKSPRKIAKFKTISR